MRSEEFSKRPEFIKGLFNSISKSYDKLNDIMSLGLHKKIKRDAIAQIGDYKPKTILDLCTGTGDLAGILKEKYPEAKIVGVDFSPQMLEIARQKYPEIEFLEADCTNLPFEDESFDLCVISFGLRNIEDMGKTIAEIHRVLRPYGLFINIDLGKPDKFFNFFLKPYLYLWVALLGKIFHGDETPYKYLAASNEDFPSQQDLMKLYKQYWFTPIKNKDYLLGQIAAQVSMK